MQEQLQLQITLSIGSRRYEIKVPKRADLLQPVRRFLQQNSLNPKLDSAIVQLVKDKLAQLDEQEQLTKSPPQKIKDKRVKSKSSKPQHLPKEEAVKSIANARQGEEESSGGTPESRKVYEEWKLREKEKKSKGTKKKPQRQQHSVHRLSTQPERHESDYFYRKGLQFQEQCEKRCEDEFKKLYPFKTTDRSLTEIQQTHLYDRLYRQREGEGDSHCRRDLPLTPNRPSPVRVDPIKQLLRREDEKVDREILKMIQSGQLSVPQRVRAVSRSPFRKTLFD